MINNGKFHLSPKDMAELESIKEFLADVYLAEEVPINVSRLANEKYKNLKTIIENAEWFS